MRLRIRALDDNWQRELDARSAGEIMSLGSQQPPTSPYRRLLARPARSAVARGLLVVYMAAIILFTFDPGRSFLVQAGLLLAPVAVGELIRSARRRWGPSDQQLITETKPLTLEERMQFKLSFLAPDLRWFLGRPPERSTYERWLTNATQQLERISPELASRWAQPDLRSPRTDEVVTAAELDARRMRLLDLYGEVASPKEVARLAADLPQAPSARAITSS